MSCPDNLADERQPLAIADESQAEPNQPPQKKKLSAAETAATVCAVISVVGEVIYIVFNIELSIRLASERSDPVNFITFVLQHLSVVPIIALLLAIVFAKRKKPVLLVFLTYSIFNACMAILSDYKIINAAKAAVNALPDWITPPSQLTEITELMKLTIAQSAVRIFAFGLLIVLLVWQSKSKPRLFADIICGLCAVCAAALVALMIVYELIIGQPVNIYSLGLIIGTPALPMTVTLFTYNYAKSRSVRIAKPEPEQA
ncbi:MAG: hypothetical protein LBO63_06155 [Oscillospiraceae bacterium]|jgi:hypothetical protein|nr:hypothetical protein [Oscillospiraceae bacterium]